MFKEYIESYLKGLLNDVDGIALVSSCLLVERNWFLKNWRFQSILCRAWL